MQIPQWVRGGGAQAARGQVSFPESPSTSVESPGLVTLGSRRAEMWSLWSQLTREKGLERTHLKMNDWTFSHWFKYNMWETSFPISLPILLLVSLFQSPVVCDMCLSLDSPLRSRPFISHQASFPHSPSLSARPWFRLYCTTRPPVPLH